MTLIVKLRFQVIKNSDEMVYQVKENIITKTQL